MLLRLRPIPALCTATPTILQSSVLELVIMAVLLSSYLTMFLSVRRLARVESAVFPDSYPGHVIDP
jgi:hypothetical protein